jgi:DNA repair exonuclease SbcCD nuclease subunit
MPIKLSYFDDLSINYVLAGHFHSNYSVRTLTNGGYFVYPGSPISITKKETGQRKVNLFEAGDKPIAYPLETPHYEEAVLDLNPFTEEGPLELITRRMKEVHPQAKVILNIKGFIDSEKCGLKETDFVDSVKKITGGRCAEEQFEFQDISSILNDDLFKSFERKLTKSNLEEVQKTQLRKLARKAMMEAKA